MTIYKLYEQQQHMYQNKVHSVENRIVSISQPWIRPIVRGKTKAPVEFGQKLGRPSLTKQSSKEKKQEYQDNTDRIEVEHSFSLSKRCYGMDLIRTKLYDTTLTSIGLKDKDTLKRNLAVVINKVDIPTLEEKIGEIAAQQYLAENAETCKSYMDARDAVCRNFLEEYGAGNFVRTAEAKFKTVRYFTCSALGHNHEGQPYEGKNVVDPVMWLLQQADSSIKAE